MKFYLVYAHVTVRESVATSSSVEMEFKVRAASLGVAYDAAKVKLKDEGFPVHFIDRVVELSEV